MCKAAPAETHQNSAHCLPHKRIASEILIQSKVFYIKTKAHTKRSDSNVATGANGNHRKSLHFTRDFQLKHYIVLRFSFGIFWQQFTLCASGSLFSENLVSSSDEVDPSSISKQPLNFDLRPCRTKNATI